MGARVKAGPSPALLGTGKEHFSGSLITGAFGHLVTKLAIGLQKAAFKGGLPPTQGKTVNMPSRNRGGP